MTICSSSVPATMRQLKARRSSDIAQAEAMMAQMPSADCRCGNSVGPQTKRARQRYTISAPLKGRARHDRRTRGG